VISSDEISLVGTDDKSTTGVASDSTVFWGAGFINKPTVHQAAINITNHHKKPPRPDFFWALFLLAFHWLKPEFLSRY
jgi:hypothetical protein